MDQSSAVPDWHRLTVAETLARLGVDAASGLSEAEAARRRLRHGANRLPEPAPRPLWRRLIDQFASVLILVLLGAALLAAAVGEWKDALVILVVVALNAGLGFLQESRAERALAALKRMLAPEAHVKRAGVVRRIAAAELVPGDIVRVEAGDRVPADGRILVGAALEVNESSLTGEAHTVGKFVEPLTQAEVPLAERGNMLYAHTVVTRGRGEFVVTATGAETEMGRVAALLGATVAPRTPLQQQLDGLGRRLAWLAAVVIAVVIGHGLLRGQAWLDVVMMAIALAVAAIPEGLPAVVTVTLALGVHRMAKQHALVKRLAAVETLGCTSVICTDKTGTLTVNQMTVRALWLAGRRYAVGGEGYRIEGRIDPEAPTLPLARALEVAALCNDAQLRDERVIGDPMEGALKVLSLKGGVDPEALALRWPRIAEVPFDPAHAFMATFHHCREHVALCVKGAPEVVLARSEWMLSAEGREAPLDEAARARVLAHNAELAGSGLRVLALAVAELPAERFDPAEVGHGSVTGLVFVGLVGLFDPPRPEARRAIAECRAAGIAVKLITGDQVSTACAIARELGLDGASLSGAELATLSPESLALRLPSIDVIARASPEHKLRLIEAWQAQGAVVAMTGDGVNDAPALRRADIGVAMGKSGTDVAKEAATMVLSDDHFATIVAAVREGRAIYDNIVKFVRFQLSTNLGAILSVLAAPGLGLPAPFTPIQILWVNIIMDGPPALALGVDPPRPELMREPPRHPAARILGLALLGRLTLYGLTMAVGTLGLYAWAYSQGDPRRAATLAFTAFVLFQVFNAFNARVGQESTFGRHFFHNRWLWVALGAVIGLQVVVVHWPVAQAVFGTSALSATDWALATVVASSVLLLDEARKQLVRGLRVLRRPHHRA